MLTIKDTEVLNYDTLLEMWAEEYILYHNKLPHKNIKFRYKLELLNEINALRKQQQLEKSE